MIRKPCCSRFLLHKFVHLKIFWTQFKNVHLRGPCSSRPCISRPYCNIKSKIYNSKAWNIHIYHRTTEQRNKSICSGLKSLEEQQVRLLDISCPLELLSTREASWFRRIRSNNKWESQRNFDGSRVAAAMEKKCQVTWGIFSAFLLKF